MSAITRRDPVSEEPAWTPPGPENPYRAIVSGFEVEQAVVTTIRRWMPQYLDEVARQSGIDKKMPMFRSIIPTSFAANRLGEDKFPALSVESPGTVERPRAYNSDSSYSARWQVNLRAIVNTRTGRSQARRLAQWYAAALRAVMIQHPALDPTLLDVMGLDWAGEQYTTRTAAQERTLGEGVVQCHVQVANVVFRSAGPWPMFEPGEPAELTTVESYDVVVTKQQEE